MSQRTHLNGDTKYRYFGYLLEIGQHKKNEPPATNPVILTQNAISQKSVTRRAEAKNQREAAVFLGDIQL